MSQTYKVQVCSGGFVTKKVRSSQGIQTYLVVCAGPYVAPTCTCPAYKYSRYTPPTCKHIAEVLNSDECCMWFRSGVLDSLDGVLEESNNVLTNCPACGKPVLILTQDEDDS